MRRREPEQSFARKEQLKNRRLAFILGIVFCLGITVVMVVAKGSINERLAIIFATWIGVLGIISAVYGDSKTDAVQVQCHDCHRIYRPADSRKCPACGSYKRVRQ